MDEQELKTRVTELYQSGLGTIKIAKELEISRSKVRRLLGRLSDGRRIRGGDGCKKKFKPSKIHVPLELRLINILADTQMRVSIDQSTVEEYAEAMREGSEFPAVSVFTNGLMYWLADGFHRYYAAREAAVETITADIYQGTLRDAQIYAMGANANHGLRRTNADKRHAVEIALADDEWRDLPNVEIARMCAVAESFVRKVKAEKSERDSHNANPDGDVPITKEQSLTESPVTTDVSEPQNKANDVRYEDAFIPEDEAPTQNPDSGDYFFFSRFDKSTRRLEMSSASGRKLYFSSKAEVGLLINQLETYICLWDDEQGGELP